MIKQRLINNIFYSSIGIILGILFCFANAEEFLKVILICVGIFVILSAIPALLMVNQNMGEKEKNATILNSIITMIIGALLVFFPGQVVYFVVGALLIVFPIIRIVVAKDHQIAFKKEIVKLILGFVILLCGVGVVLKTFLVVIGVCLIVCSLAYLIYNIFLLMKINKTNKKDSNDSDVIDV